MLVSAVYRVKMCLYRPRKRTGGVQLRLQSSAPTLDRGNYSFSRSCRFNPEKEVMLRIEQNVLWSQQY